MYSQGTVFSGAGQSSRGPTFTPGMLAGESNDLARSPATSAATSASVFLDQTQPPVVIEIEETSLSSIGRGARDLRAA